MKINREEFRDKLYACWIGKNIGGTLGAPYEGQRVMHDIKGFTTKPGEPLPNDDLDLQLLWLYTIEKHGINKFSQNMLADYWIDWVTPHWNEYGIAKANLKLGLLPPLSGEVENERWQTSNGAWIRSEIWAALTPGCSDLAMKYASMDAMVDHGLGEGTYAEMFTAALQSAAYFESDIRKLLDIALAKIPSDSRLAKAVKLVISCYENGESYIEAREKLVEQSKDIGWFQAPANVGFVVIGLLYGEGDFKKSCLYAINCGDDTDCTGATVGATMGIIGGTKAIPEDWREHIGDGINTICVNGQFSFYLPKTCTELTERIMKQIPEIMRFNEIDLEFTDGETEADDEFMKKHNSKTADDFLTFERYSYEVLHNTHIRARVEILDNPKISANETRKVRLSFYNNFDDAKRISLRLILPEGWSCSDYAKTICLEMEYNQSLKGAQTEFTVCAGEKTDAINRLYMEATSPCISQPLLVPITFIG